MPDPLTIPCSPADISTRIASHWGGELGAARRQGLDPERITARVLPDGATIGLNWQPYNREGQRRALSGLLDVLEDDGLVVDRERGAVKGWAAVANEPRLMTLAELHANPWASCGSAALAGLLGRPLADIRHAFPNQQEGRTWTNLSQMEKALGALGIRYARAVSADASLFPVNWPLRGLVLIQFRGSWDAMPIGHPAQLQRTHWIAARPLAAGRLPFCFDVNVVGSEWPTAHGWTPRSVWEGDVAPWLAAGYGKKATGAWWVRAGIEVEVPPPALVPIVSLDITDPRRAAYFDGVLADREARRAPMPVERAEKLRRFGR
jgi:hypothetical protein